MARPKTHKQPRVSTGIRLDRDLYDDIHAAAEEREVSVNWLMCRLLREGIDRLVPVDELVLRRDG